MAPWQRGKHGVQPRPVCGGALGAGSRGSPRCPRGDGFGKPTFAETAHDLSLCLGAGVFSGRCLWAQGRTFCLRKAGGGQGMGREEAPSSLGSLRSPGLSPRCPRPGSEDRVPGASGQRSSRMEPGRWPGLGGLETQFCRLTRAADLEHGSLSFTQGEEGGAGRYLRVVVFPGGSCHALTRVPRVLARVASWKLICMCQIGPSLLCQRWLVVQLGMKQCPGNEKGVVRSPSPQPRYNILVVILGVAPLR